MSDDNVMSERPRELARSGPEVGKMMANENGGSGARQKEACGTRRAACQGQKNGAGGRGPLFLSGYRGGQPYYLYADGTAPARSKAAARPSVLDSGVVWHAGARRASLRASLHAAQCDDQGGAHGQGHGSGAAGRSAAVQAAARLPARAPDGMPPGLPGMGHAARHGGEESAEWAAMRCWEEARRRMRADVVAAVAQATVRHRAGRRMGLPCGEQRSGASQPSTARGQQHGELADPGAEDSEVAALRLQLEEAAVAILRLQGVVASQGSRVEALEEGARTSERHEARWPRMHGTPARHASGARNLQAAFDDAAAGSPESGAHSDLVAQAEELWSEVEAVRAEAAVALTAVVAPAARAGARAKKPDRSDIPVPGQPGGEAAGLEPVTAEAVAEPSGDSDADGVEAAEAVPAAAEAEPELTAEAAAAVAQAAAVIEELKSSTGRLGRYFEETDEEFARRMNAVGTIIEMEYRELYNIFRKTAGPADTHAVLAERYSGGVWKEGKAALERRAAWLCRGGMTESRRSSLVRDGSEGFVGGC